ncbi:MAG: FKBP-type peptidyl-prolyl cis-trans isomerase [Bacteroidales bacterium]|nr:FKBP-type peptidyl-prolyl cis-trans isomerase [Bacteroidales bacterium]
MNLIKIVFFVSAIILLLFSCDNSESYKKHESGFEYKIITKENTNLTVKEDEILDLKLRYFNQNDSLIFDSETLPGKFRVQVLNPETGGLFQEAITMLNIGDSAVFLIPAQNFYKETMKKQIPNFVKKDETFKFEVKINKSVSEEELNKEYRQYLLEAEYQESALLKEYTKNEHITEAPTEDGLYIIQLEKGKGKKASAGKTATVHYTGKLINGQVFDSSVDRGEPVKFLIGQGDVIPAWDKAILKMREGDKIKLITSSKYAYGEFGFEKIVPPFTTLIFEIKLIDIN